YVRNGEKYLATRTLPSDKYGKDSVQLLFQPLGVLFMVEPWNFPYYQIVRVAAPQLFAGNTLILKHASIVPESAATFVEIFREAGLP
ncbi:aldehyde dehydrogenase family protein, partial [Streptococcus anginosus]|nr:aldehyde dehydrogenase family protein [Streptococcus anginosus]